MSRKLAFAMALFFVAAVAVQASPITSITGTYGGFASGGGNQFHLDQGSILSGGALAGGQAKNLNLDFSSYFSNPGMVGATNDGGGLSFYLGAAGLGQAAFGFNGPLTLTSTPSEIRFTGTVGLLETPAGLDLSAFENGGTFTMTFDPTQFSIVAGPEGGLVAFAQGIGSEAIQWSITAEAGGGGGGGTGGGGGPEVPEPLALVSFGALSIGGVWAARRRRAKRSAS